MVENQMPRSISVQKKHTDNVQCIAKNQKLSFVVDTNEQWVINAECLFSAFLLEHSLPLSALGHADSYLKKCFQIVKLPKNIYVHEYVHEYVGNQQTLWLTIEIWTFLVAEP